MLFPEKHALDSFLTNFQKPRSTLADITVAWWYCNGGRKSSSDLSNMPSIQIGSLTSQPLSFHLGINRSSPKFYFLAVLYPNLYSQTRRATSKNPGPRIPSVHFSILPSFRLIFLHPSPSFFTSVSTEALPNFSAYHFSILIWPRWSPSGPKSLWSEQNVHNYLQLSFIFRTSEGRVGNVPCSSITIYRACISSESTSFTIPELIGKDVRTYCHMIGHGRKNPFGIINKFGGLDAPW